jgi:hypothetical protein
MRPLASRVGFAYELSTSTSRTKRLEQFRFASVFGHHDIGQSGQRVEGVKPWRDIGIQGGTDGKIEKRGKSGKNHG